ncbi:MAG TPA: hypothetical protein VFH95_14960 [Candidatus Kapabacteria bacterium]|nr:hypothetical protein [Candidatus Kapabacteria bacterium]
MASRRRNPFEGIDFNREKPVPLRPVHAKGSTSFQCLRAGFRTRLGKSSDELKSHICTGWAYVLKRRIAAFLTIQADQLRFESAEKGKTVSLPDGDFEIVPAVKLMVLARDSRATGAGKALLAWVIDYIIREIVPRLGVRFLTVDAYYEFDARGKLDYDSGPYYAEQFDFRYVDPKERPHPDGEYRSMYLDLLPLEEAMKAR